MSQRGLKKAIRNMAHDASVLRDMVKRYRDVIADLYGTTDHTKEAEATLWSRVASLEHRIGALEGEIAHAETQVRGSWRSRIMRGRSWGEA
jgi:uncharacterized small protein (DUF1192 family)